VSHVGKVARCNPGPDAYLSHGVPTGSTLEFEDWTETEVFTGTKRDVVLYVPPNFERSGPPPAVLICNDGYADPAGRVRAMTVLDNLLHRGRIGPTVAVFADALRWLWAP
jgi:enterochelin esterase-like enzyme